MLHITSIFLSVLALATSTLAQNPVLIGYRRVSADQATIYQNDNGILKFTGNRAGLQLGTGVYLLKTWDGWFAAEWDCAFFADQADWANINKAYVPPTSDCKPLWWTAGIPNIGAYLQGMKPTLSVANTALLAWMDGWPNVQQMLISDTMLTNSNGLKVMVQCAPLNSKDPNDQKQLEIIHGFGEVDYSAWQPLGNIGPQTLEGAEL